jgi:hypothetical protein
MKFTLNLLRFGLVRTRFRQIAICLNLELDLRFGSGWRPNLELNLGSVRIGSGLNLAITTAAADSTRRDPLGLIG